MSGIQFIPNDQEAILSETIATYQQATGETLNPTDPERIMIDVMAYRESALRARMEFLMRQNFVQYATAPALDNRGHSWVSVAKAAKRMTSTAPGY